MAPPVTPAEQGLHRRAPGTHPQGGSRELLWQDWQHRQHRAKVRTRPDYRAECHAYGGAVPRANRVGYGFVVSSIVTSPSGSRSDRSLFHRNSTTARPRKRVWRSTTRAISWETRYVSRSLMAADAPQSTAATRGRASSAARWVIGPGQTSPIHSGWRSELTQLLLSRECPNHLAAGYVFGTDLPG